MFVCACESVRRGEGVSGPFNDIFLGGLLTERVLLEENGNRFA